MLFLLNKTQPDTLSLIRLLGGEKDKAILLIGDATFYATSSTIQKFKEIGVEQIYAAEEDIAERNIELCGDYEAVDYDRIVSLIMEEYEKVVSI
mgnify:CR=1 FL=1